ncbi:putative oxidoreductase, partial [Globisporangium splendens]
MLLLSGATIPRFGLGVYRTKRGAETYNAVLHAFKIGYRHIDTAQWYRNESDVGDALRDSGLPRHEVFLTTKLWIKAWGYDNAVAAIQESNEKLGGTYIDLLLLHAPGNKDTRADTWRALEEMQARGVVRDIGVSNFGIPHLEMLALTAKVPPAVNQIELHPWLARKELVDYCRSKSIVVEAYSPLTKGKMLDHPVLLEIAAQVSATPAQALVAYSLAKDYIVIAKSVDPSRQQENLDASAMQTDAKHLLTDAHLARLEALDEHLVVAWDPIANDEV